MMRARAAGTLVFPCLLHPTLRDCVACAGLLRVSLSEAVIGAVIVIPCYSIGRIMLSIKAISSSVRPYFLYSISSVHGWEKS